MAPVNDHSDNYSETNKKVIDLDSLNENSRKSSVGFTLKHPFFMAPAERAAHRVSEHINASNALNRAIQINLISEDESEGDINNTKLSKSAESNAFFQKRVKLASSESNSSVKLKKISTDPPPYPYEFQLQKQPFREFVADSISSQINKSINTSLIDMDKSIAAFEVTPFAQIIKEKYADMNVESLNRLNNFINDRSIGISSTNRHLITAILNETELNLSASQPVLWVLTGPPGIGKTKMVESIAESLDFRLITIDSTQGPRNSKTFETLQITLSHSTPRSFSQFFSTPEKTSKKQKIAILFDEVEIAFESDRGFWSALGSFLQSPSAKSFPVFMTSNAPRYFLESIIKFPEHATFLNFNGGDQRKLSNNTDFIGRLHRIDTTMEFEQLVHSTGYYSKSSEDIIDDYCDTSVDNNYERLIEEGLRWDGILSNIRKDSVNFDFYAYAECSSLADMLLTVKDTSVRMNMDIVDNVKSEFFAYDCTEIPSVANTLLYSDIPEIYESKLDVSIDLATELLERTIYSFSAELDTSIDYVNGSIIFIEGWKDLSRRTSKRFFDYARNLQPTQVWLSEILPHVISLESYNFHDSSIGNRGRRKRQFYRFIDKDLLDEILGLK